MRTIFSLVAVFIGVLALVYAGMDFISITAIVVIAMGSSLLESK